MYEYDDEVLRVFLKKQLQLFDEPVAETMEEAEAFLEDCMAVVVDSLYEVREFFEEEGMDASGMSDEELEEIAVEYLNNHSGCAFIMMSAMNIDRVITAKNIAKRTNRVFLEDIYTADITSSLNIISKL